MTAALLLLGALLVLKIALILYTLAALEESDSWYHGGGEGSR